MEKIQTSEVEKTMEQINSELELFTTAYLLMFIHYDRQEDIWYKLRSLRKPFYIHKHKNEAMKYFHSLPTRSYSRHSYSDNEIFLEGKLGLETEEIVTSANELFETVLHNFRMNMGKYLVNFLIKLL